MRLEDEEMLKACCTLTFRDLMFYDNYEDMLKDKLKEAIKENQKLLNILILICKTKEKETGISSSKWLQFYLELEKENK